MQKTYDKIVIKSIVLNLRNFQEKIAPSFFIQNEPLKSKSFEIYLMSNADYGFSSVKYVTILLLLIFMKLKFSG